jgi:hypothetical protein
MSRGIPENAQGVLLAGGTPVVLLGRIRVTQYPSCRIDDFDVCEIDLWTGLGLRMRLQQGRLIVMGIRRILGAFIPLILVVWLIAGCESATLSLHISSQTGMKGSFRTRTGEVEAPLAPGTGTLVLEVKTLELEDGTMEIRLEDGSGQVIWKRGLTPADAGQVFAVGGDVAKAKQWVLRSDKGRRGRYELVWNWQ